MCLQPWGPSTSAAVAGCDPERASSCPDLLLQLKPAGDAEGSNKEAPKWPHYWLDAGLFLEPAFLLLSLSTLLLFMCFIVPYLFLAEHMLLHGYTQVRNYS
jgi:MFS transporter, MCT family, solute carrier family 16 (monocarboxylic acid transporters), member 14